MADLSLSGIIKDKSKDQSKERFITDPSSPPNTPLVAPPAADPSLGAITASPFASPLSLPYSTGPNYAPQTTTPTIPSIGNTPNGKIIGSEITAKTGEVGDDMLVAKQMARVLGENSQYVQQARARAMQTANARGLMNSSLAAQGGEEAAIAASLPIAQQDASTYFTNQRDNLAAQNQYGLADKSASLQDILQGRDLDNRYKIAAENNSAQIQAAGIGAGASVEAARIRAEVDRAQLAQNGS